MPSLEDQSNLDGKPFSQPEPGDEKDNTHFNEENEKNEGAAFEGVEDDYDEEYNEYDSNCNYEESQDPHYDNEGLTQDVYNDGFAYKTEEGNENEDHDVLQSEDG